MQETEHSEELSPDSMTEDIAAGIADKVREDSSSHGRLTAAEFLGALTPDLAPDSIAESLDWMAEDERYTDIQALVLPSEAIYYYSDVYITPPEALEKGKIKEVQAKIASKVRDVSKSLAELTGVDTLADVDPDVESDDLQTALEELAEDDRYGDIRLVTSSTGADYLYSETYITRSYAGILIRAAANDPCATIAATVRDESRIYPRPTPVELFREPIFNIEAGELDVHVARVLQREEYQDIKKIVASTGAVYLYSDLYLHPNQALAQVEWTEVGQDENP